MWRSSSSLREPLTAALAAVFLCTALTACSMAPGTTVPDLMGMELSEAASSLLAHELFLGSVTYDAASEESTWTVTSQSVEGEIEPGSLVDVVLAGAPPMAVPDLAGLDAAIALEQATADGFVVSVVESFNEVVSESAVVSQDPAASTQAPTGSTIRLVVSLGPKSPASRELRLEQIDHITGPYSPKSIVATQEGRLFAQNMMYRHTITVFDANTREVLKTIPDQVDLSEFGHDGGVVKGAPVEAAVTPDGQYVYVSNYSMFGPGFSRPGDDDQGPEAGADPSYVYRVSLETLEIDQVIEVGSVPKFMAVTPDGRYCLVSDWVSYTVSVIDIEAGERVEAIRVGRHPRGIAVTQDSSKAYIAVMGSRDVAVLDLDDFSVDWVRGVGTSPRHLILSPDDDYLYATLNGESRVVKIDLATGEVVARVATGSQPRSMTMAPDGGALYVVNYESDSVSKVLTDDMTEVQELPTDHHPIGIAYVDELSQVWVSCYAGAFRVYQDR